MRGGELDGYFGMRGLPVGIQECLRRCTDYLVRQFIPKWDSPNGEGELVTTRTTSLLMEFEGGLCL